MDNCVCGIVSGFFLDYPFSYRQHFTPMPFQFYCPNGHLLQANENQIGQTCVCPHCQVEIIIPAPAGYTPASPATPPDAPTTQPPVSAFTGFNPQGQTAPSPMNLNIQKKKEKIRFWGSLARIGKRRSKTRPKDEYWRSRRGQQAALLVSDGTFA